MFSKLTRLSGLTKTELAEKLGITVGTIYNWKEDAPQYAIAYLELLIEYNRIRP